MGTTLETAILLFFFSAGKTAEGVGETPGSCSKTQDFQFTTPETWPKNSKTQNPVKAFDVFLFKSSLAVSCLVVFCWVLCCCVLFC